MQDLLLLKKPLSKSAVWQHCASEWGQGAGFKGRVANRLEQWFDGNAGLKEKLEEIATGFWEQLVIHPVLRLSEETAPESPTHAGNIVRSPRKQAPKPGWKLYFVGAWLCLAPITLTGSID